ncbi:MAG: hypothetical protein JNL98_04085 [Bryobacterales bacterium]|nr:hypothetical protein [Bryobacterales bacterium]
MPQPKTLVSTAAAVAALYFAVTSGPAVAQAVRATLVRSADERGRNPYESTVQFNQFLNGQFRNLCFPSSCGVLFAPVPEGKRLVLENITGLLRINGRVRFLALASDRGENPHLNVLPLSGTYSTDLPGSGFNSDVYLFNEQIRGYIEPGQTPLLSIVGDAIFAFNRGQFSQVKLTGYLVDLEP